MRTFAVGLVTIVTLHGCAGQREVSKLRYTTTDCPDPQGCEAPLGETAFQPPDEHQAQRDIVAETVAGPPEVSCATVAVALTSLELGNYASDHDDYDATVANHRTACEGAKLDERELACMSTVTAVTHVGYCTRKLGAPTKRVQLVAAQDCRKVVDGMRDAIAYIPAPSGQYDPSGQTGPRAAASLADSCANDGWPVELATCFSSNQYDNPLATCRGAAPGWLFDQITARMEQLAQTTKR